jgi:PhnB protein
MSTVLNPYLNFRGNARQAMEFYQQVLGGELTLNTYADLMGDTGDEKDQIMHSQLVTSAGFTLMGSDVPSHMSYAVGDNAFSVSLSGDDEAELTGYWQKLSDGADVGQPLEKAPWGDSFGMLHDRFGVSWLVNISGGGMSA